MSVAQRVSAPITAIMLGFLTACVSKSNTPESLPMGVARERVGEVSVLVAGPDRGPAIIYVHGTPGSATQWESYLERPVAGTRSIAVDRPGFGQSGDDAVTSFGEQAAALEPLFDARDGRRPILVGHSLGGPIVARAAADFPDRVGGIVILAGSLDPALEKPRWYNHLAGGVRGMLKPSIRNSNDEIMAAPEETVALASVLDRVTCPVVILHGRKDGLVPVANVDFMHRAFTSAAAIDATMLDDAGHLLIWRREAETRGAIGRAMELGWGGGGGGKH
ncbi:MAG: alpha/beta hydrolase [Planctomycetota bacterium]